MSLGQQLFKLNKAELWLLKRVRKKHPVPLNAKTPSNSITELLGVLRQYSPADYLLSQSRVFDLRC
jgi:hypothetical protein